MARPEGTTGGTLDDAIDELQKIAKLAEVSNDIQTGIQSLLTGRPAVTPRAPTVGGTPAPLPLPTPSGAPPAPGTLASGHGASSSSSSSSAPSGFFRSRIHRFKAWRSRTRGGAYKAGRAAGMGRKSAAGLGRAAGKVGGVAAVVVGVVTAFDEAKKAVGKWTEEALKTARQLSLLSGSMAVVMAERDIMEMSRMIRRGEATAGSAQKLVQAESRRKEEQLKIDIALDNLKNGLLAWANDRLAGVLGKIASAVTFIAKKLGLEGEAVEPGGLGMALGLAEKENDKINAAGKSLMDIARAASKIGGAVGPAGANAPGFGAMKPPMLP